MILKNPDGTITNYKTFGSQPPLKRDGTSKTLLLLHGIGADNAMWQPQMQRYASLGYHVVVPDLVWSWAIFKIEQYRFI
ncbi:MAG: alpha/beta hydrolase [Cyanobacteria bacterium P01_D01_bin.50]